MPWGPAASAPRPRTATQRGERKIAETRAPFRNSESYRPVTFAPRGLAAKTRALFLSAPYLLLLYFSTSKVKVRQRCARLSAAGSRGAKATGLQNSEFLNSARVARWARPRRLGPGCCTHRTRPRVCRRPSKGRRAHSRDRRNTLSRLRLAHAQWVWKNLGSRAPHTGARHACGPRTLQGLRGVGARSLLARAAAVLEPTFDAAV